MLQRQKQEPCSEVSLESALKHRYSHGQPLSGALGTGRREGQAQLLKPTSTPVFSATHYERLPNSLSKQIWTITTENYLPSWQSLNDWENSYFLTAWKINHKPHLPKLQYKKIDMKLSTLVASHAAPGSQLHTRLPSLILMFMANIYLPKLWHLFFHSNSKTLMKRLLLTSVAVKACSPLEEDKRHFPTKQMGKNKLSP